LWKQNASGPVAKPKEWQSALENIVLRAGLRQNDNLYYRPTRIQVSQQRNSRKNEQG